jgi:AsmA protein
VEQATFDLYGGKVRATGTEADIWRGAMPFKARLAATNVDVGHLLAGEFDSTGLLSGKGNLDVELDGEGFDMDALQQHLTGGWSLALQNGKLSTAAISTAVLGGLADIPGLAPQKLASEGDLRDLLAGFVVEKGRMNLKKPIQLQLDGSKVELDGAVGIAGDLFLDGTYFVSPQLVSRVTGGRCTISQPAGVPLSVTGSAAKPSVKPDTRALGVLVAKSCLAGKAQEAVDRLTGGAAKEAIGKAESQVEEASAAARQKADEVKAEAEQKRKATEEKAKEKARDEAKKLKGKLGF